jgi:hypothetical protein
VKWAGTRVEKRAPVAMPLPTKLVQYERVSYGYGSQPVSLSQDALFASVNAGVTAVGITAIETAADVPTALRRASPAPNTRSFVMNVNRDS